MSVKPTYEELERYGRQADITIENLEQKLAESQREFRAADATIENLQMQVEKLAEENYWLKISESDLDSMCAEMSEETWESVLTKTPSTDAFLAEVRAHGVEMLREHPAIKLCSLTHVCDEFAAQLRKGVQS